MDTVRRVAAGGTAMGPQVIQQLLSRRQAADRPLGRQPPRELEVLALMARGRSNAAIAAQLAVTERRSGITPATSSRNEALRSRTTTTDAFWPFSPYSDQGRRKRSGESLAPPNGIQHALLNFR